MTTTKQKLITADELLAMPRDGNRYELVRGVLIKKMPTGDPHGMVVVLTAHYMTQYALSSGHGQTRSGETGYILDRDPDTVRAPDVAWYSPDNIPPPGTRGFPDVVPDLVVEVKSPSNSNSEMAAKSRMWLWRKDGPGYGAKMALVLDPQTETVIKYKPDSTPTILTTDDVLDGDDVLPGFSCLVRRFFHWEQ